MSTPEKSDSLAFIFAIAFGTLAGYLHVGMLDSSLSVLLVTAAAMFLSYWRPKRVGIWAAIMGLCLPTAALIALLTHSKPTRGMVIGSFAGIAFSIVAGVGGVVLRRVVRELFPGSDDSPRVHPH